jgi:hypothetical protein
MHRGRPPVPVGILNCRCERGPVGRAGYSAGHGGYHGGMWSRQFVGIGDVVRSGRGESGVLRRWHAFVTPVLPVCLRAWLFRDSGSVLGWMCRVGSGRTGRCFAFRAGPGGLPGRAGWRLPGRFEQESGSGHRPAFPGPLGPLTLAASATRFGSTCSGSACSGSACSTCSGSTCSACLACSDLVAFGRIGSVTAGADAGGSGRTGSDEVGVTARAGQQAEVSSSARRWNAAAALAVLPYQRLSFRACRCVSPHSRCLACSRRNTSASAE